MLRNFSAKNTLKNTADKFAYINLTQSSIMQVMAPKNDYFALCLL